MNIYFVNFQSVSNFLSAFFQPELTLESVTRDRLIMEKRFYLNASNTKYVKIGFKPATKLFNKEFTGFFVEVAIDGKNMRPMALGGIDGFMNICKSLRSFDELKYTYPGSSEDYTKMKNAVPINISKKYMSGSLCFCIETQLGDSCMIAQNSCTELLKYECLIAASIKKMVAMVGDVEKQFNDLVAKSSSDFSELLAESAKSGDLMKIEIITNFNDLFKICVDEATRFNSTTTISAETSPKRKRAVNPKRTSKKPKPNDCTEHNYALVDIDETEDVEIIENNKESESGTQSGGEEGLHGTEVLC